MADSWRAYHGDGRTWDSTQRASTDLPAGVVGVVEFMDPPYRRIVDGGDWFWMEAGRWHASGTVWDGWVDKPHPQAIQGAGLPDDRWQEIQRAMMADREWPGGR